MKTINERIDHIRTSLGYPMNAFARKLGSSASAVANVLGEKKDDPSMRMINSILSIFPVNKEWIFMGTGPIWSRKDLSDFKFDSHDGPETDVALISRVKKVRADQDMSQAIFASEIGMSRDALAFMETNRSMLQVPVLKRIVKRFRVNCDWLLFGEGDPYQKKKI